MAVTLEGNIREWFARNSERWARYPDVKSTTLGGIDRYCLRYPPGHFITRLMENDLMGAMGHADGENKKAIVDICRYVYNEIPAGVSHGSVKAVDSWLTGEPITGTSYQIDNRPEIQAEDFLIGRGGITQE